MRAKSHSGRGTAIPRLTQQDWSDSDEETVPPADAYSKLLKGLHVNATKRREKPARASKRQKLDRQAVNKDIPDVQQRQEPAVSLEKDQLDDNARGEASTLQCSTRAHLERVLKEEPEEAFRHARKLANMQGAVFHQPDGAWGCSGPQVQVFPRLEQYSVQNRLQGLWKDALKAKAEAESDFASTEQKAFFALARSYKDILDPGYPYPSSVDEQDLKMDAILLHCLDHIASSAQTIKRHNEALKADSSLECPRDQGFTRPKVLLLLPMRNTAHRVVSRFLKLAQKETRNDSIQGKARFNEEFGPIDEDKDAAAKSKHHCQEHSVLFHGNTDDHFRMGIKLTRGAVKLYADFFQSDIIVASPIALATKIAEAEGKTSEEIDFLSSIEVAIAARCDVMQMQNWQHVRTVFETLNKLPTDLHGVDVMRVREWYLQGQARRYRQNILLSSFCFPELRALLHGLCFSHAGLAKLQLHHEGVIGNSSLQVHQSFEKFSASDMVEDMDKRLEHFKARIWPRIRDSGSAGQMLFVPSYLDYVQLRSFLRKEEFDFEGLSEYATGSEVARGRSRFATGKVRLALYTERAHFYHRRRTRGVKDLYFYQLPEHAQYYNELVGLLASENGTDAGHSTVTVMFSNIDAPRLERIVGSKNVKKMRKSASKNFIFSSL